MAAPSAATPRSRSCARPGCATPAAATLRFAYTTREARIDPLEDEAPPQSYDLCAAHAARTRPPAGWSLRDARSEADAAAGRDLGTEPHPYRTDGEEAAPAVRGLPALGGEETIARLTAALRAAAGPGTERREGVDEAV